MIRWINYKKKKSNTDIYLSNKNKLKLTTKSLFNELDLAWFNYFLSTSTMKNLLKNNIYKKYFNNKKIRLLHITPSIKKIIVNEFINPSGGGLGSAIYCSPVDKNLRMHNLARLYFDFQLPKKIKKDIGILFMEIELPTNQDYSEWCVDYTDFGKIHCLTWDKIKNQKKDKYYDELEERIENQIKTSLDIINKFVKYDLKNQNFDEFNKNYNELFNNIPSLRFIIYEVLAEYILLYQNNKLAIKHLKKGEIYNLNHKQFIWDLTPWMFKKFDMKSFFISLNDIITYLNKKDIITNFDLRFFQDFIKWRIPFYIKKITKTIINPNKTNFKFLVKSHPYLTGQIVYREFIDKNLFEIFRSKFIYDLWKLNKVICPIYSIIPKGEVGINPNLELFGAKIKFYNAKISKNSNTLIKGKQLNINLSNQLISKSECNIRGQQDKIKPLYILAKEDKLGDNQKLDLETLNWIKNNSKPKFINIKQFLPDYKPLDLNEFRKFIPNEDWFLNQKRIKGIHGLSHILRVILYSYIVSYIINYKDYNLALIASSIHDLRRISDKNDIEHSERAALWFKKTKLPIKKNLSKENVNSITLTIGSHNKKSKNQLTNILKFSDAIDRYRLPKLKWWPNKELLNLKLDSWLFDLSKYLVYETEKNIILNKVSPEDAIIKIGLKLDILK